MAAIQLVNTSTDGDTVSNSLCNSPKAAVVEDICGDGKEISLQKENVIGGGDEEEGKGEEEGKEEGEEEGKGEGKERKGREINGQIAMVQDDNDDNENDDEDDDDDDDYDDEAKKGMNNYDVEDEESEIDEFSEEEEEVTDIGRRRQGGSKVH